MERDRRNGERGREHRKKGQQMPGSTLEGQQPLKTINLVMSECKGDRKSVI